MTPHRPTPATQPQIPTHDTSHPGAYNTPGAHPASFLLQPGAKPLPEYQLVRKLGEGGFGQVWLALGPGGFEVALKFLRMSETTGEAELRALQIIKGIRHPHLLSVFGFWQVEEYLIVAMELADRSLADRLKEAVAQGHGGVPYSELLECMRDAARGLDFLNDKGIQHRDVKPHNLFLSGGGVKVADFGLAKVLERSIATASTKMTPAYSAPEFLNGQATKWSDQYSLAVTYCHLRGNRLPFTGMLTEILAGHMIRQPDLTMMPESERPIVLRAMAKKPTERWPNCRAFVEALAQVDDLQPLPDPMPVSNHGDYRTPQEQLSPTPREWQQAPPQIPVSGGGSSFRILLLLSLFLLLGGATGVGVLFFLLDKQQKVVEVLPTTPRSSSSQLATPPEKKAPGISETKGSSPTLQPSQSQPKSSPTKPIPTPKDEPPKPTEKKTDPPPPPPEKLTLTLDELPTVKFKPGERATVTIRVKRTKLDDPVRLSLTLPSGISATREVEIPSGQQQVQVAFTTTEDLEPGLRWGKVLAQAGELHDEKQMEILVEKPLALLSIKDVQPVRFRVGEKNAATIRIQRKHFRGAVELKFANVPKWLDLPPTFVPADSEEVNLELAARPGAKSGTYTLNLLATASEAKAEGRLEIHLEKPSVAVSPFSTELARQHQALWAGERGVTTSFTNDLGMKLVLIPPGEYMQGSEESAEDVASAFDERPSVFQAEFPQHRTKLTKPYYLGTCEVTEEQFQRFLRDNPDYQPDVDRYGRQGDTFNPNEGKFNPDRKDLQGQTQRPVRPREEMAHPAVWVSWRDAQAFCRWLSRKESRSYRLPTEAEWEFACRGGTTTRYWNGNDPEKLIEIANVPDATYLEDYNRNNPGIPNKYRTVKGSDGYAGTAPVGQFRANPFGLHDMHGNVWEWCQDRYATDAYRYAPETDPTGPTEGDKHVIRGGCFI